MTTRTFDPALTTSKDRMRFALGDTGVATPKAADADALLLPVDDAVYAGALAYRGNDEVDHEFDFMHEGEGDTDALRDILIAWARDNGRTDPIAIDIDPEAITCRDGRG